MLIPGKYHVMVTPEDIANGVRDDAGACPIALALLRIPGIESVEVESSRPTIEAGMPQWDARCVPTQTVDDFIQQFDLEMPVQPFEFDLQLEYREYDPD